VQLTFDDATEAFRQSFEAWLDEHAPAEAATRERSRSSAHVPAWARRWQRDLFDHGWLVPGNPPEHGGRSATVVEQFVHHEVLARRSIYLSFNPQGLGIVVPSLLAFGTDPQKQRWALPLLRAEITAALGMSEPNAGSDLAGLRTRAVLDGDQFVVNGQKVWTSGAHDADVILAFVRTDPDAPKHKGISALLIPTDLPGVTRRPFGSVIARDELDFNEVFFDDVRVPAENLVGELHGGWGVANGSLGHERSMLWLDYSQRLDEFIDDYALAVPETDHDRDGRFHDAFAAAAIDAQALRLLGYRAVANARRGLQSNDASVLKLFGSESVQRTLGEAVDRLGPAALDNTIPSRHSNHLQLDLFDASWFDRYLRSFSGTIAGGTSEIQRNIVAERVLGLPR
jgi:alkylation response protein AidB-like acyl-CoA dehydrogenase